MDDIEKSLILPKIEERPELAQRAALQIAELEGKSNLESDAASYYYEDESPKKQEDNSKRKISS